MSLLPPIPTGGAGAEDAALVGLAETAGESTAKAATGEAFSPVVAAPVIRQARWSVDEVSGGSKRDDEAAATPRSTSGERESGGKGRPRREQWHQAAAVAAARAQGRSRWPSYCSSSSWPGQAPDNSSRYYRHKGNI